jgi:signal transduction histidine kinase
MRGPLGVIRGQCHAIVRCATRPEAIVERLRVIDAEVERMVSTIERIRSALGGCSRDEPPIPVDLASLVRETVQRHEGCAAERGVTLTARAPAVRRDVVGRADDLRRLADNLVSNAIRHAPFGTRVVLAIGGDARTVTLRVSDRGGGFDPSRPAADGGNDDRGGQGWGIGLGIAREIVAAHRGRITLEPHGPGTTFRVDLPVTWDPQVAAA